MKGKPGEYGAQLLAYAQMRGVRSVRIGEIAGLLGIMPKQERELFSRLARAGVIARVRRGLWMHSHARHHASGRESPFLVAY